MQRQTTFRQIDHDGFRRGTVTLELTGAGWEDAAGRPVELEPAGLIAQPEGQPIYNYRAAAGGPSGQLIDSGGALTRARWADQG